MYAAPHNFSIITTAAAAPAAAATHTDAAM